MRGGELCRGCNRLLEGCLQMPEGGPGGGRESGAPRFGDRRRRRIPVELVRRARADALGTCKRQMQLRSFPEKRTLNRRRTGDMSAEMGGRGDTALCEALDAPFRYASGFYVSYLAAFTVCLFRELSGGKGRLCRCFTKMGNDFLCRYSHIDIRKLYCNQGCRVL